MNEELKFNRCGMFFDCNFDGECVYFRKKDDDPDYPYCRYMDDDTGCLSAVARVNAMVIELKKHGIDHQNRDFIKKIGDLLQESLDSGTGLKPVEDAMNMINEYLYSK